MIVSPDAANQIDGSIQKHILSHLPEFPVSIIPISWFPNFVFKKPDVRDWILIDFMEPHSANVEYNKFWEWVTDNPPILTFRRELHEKDVRSHVKPIEWACWPPIPPTQTKEQYDSRPIEVLFVWGFSNMNRPRLHGEIFMEGFKHCKEVVDNWNDIDRHKKFWATIYAPYWRRKPMNELAPIMEKAKITVSLPGNGLKTFRDTECVGTLIARHNDGIAFAYPWDSRNSIKLIPMMEIKCLLDAVNRDDLYELYRNCDDNMRKYTPERYANEYVAAEIRKIL